MAPMCADAMPTLSVSLAIQRSKTLKLNLHSVLTWRQERREKPAVL